MIRVFRPIPVESLKLLVFDLDGTLIDSAQDLCNSVNATLTHFDRHRCPTRSVATLSATAPDAGAPRALPPTTASTPTKSCFARAYAFFLDYYREHKLDYTYAYDGVLEALAALRNVHDQPGRACPDHGRTHQQARAPRAGHLRSPRPGALFPQHLRRQQFSHQEAQIPKGCSSLMRRPARAPKRRS